MLAKVRAHPGYALQCVYPTTGDANRIYQCVRQIKGCWHRQGLRAVLRKDVVFFYYEKTT